MRTGPGGDGAPVAGAVLLDVGDEHEVLLRRPGALLDALLVAARRPPPALSRSPACCLGFPARGEREKGTEGSWSRSKVVVVVMVMVELEGILWASPCFVHMVIEPWYSSGSWPLCAMTT